MGKGKLGNDLFKALYEKSGSENHTVFGEKLGIKKSYVSLSLSGRQSMLIDTASKYVEKLGFRWEYKKGEFRIFKPRTNNK